MRTLKLLFWVHKERFAVTFVCIWIGYCHKLQYRLIITRVTTKQNMILLNSICSDFPTSCSWNFYPSKWLPHLFIVDTITTVLTTKLWLIVVIDDVCTSVYATLIFTGLMHKEMIPSCLFTLPFRLLSHLVTVKLCNESNVQVHSWKNIGTLNKSSNGSVSLIFSNSDSEPTGTAAGSP